MPYDSTWRSVSDAVGLRLSGGDMDAVLEKQTSESLILSRRAGRTRRFVAGLGQGLLFLVASLSAMAVLFIFFFITRDAIPFFRVEGFAEFFRSTAWHPSSDDASFGALAIFVGSGLVTLGAILVAVPLGIMAAVCLSDILPFGIRQVAKPIMEMLAAIPSVAYGFFALVVLAPLLQKNGGHLLAATAWVIGLPLSALCSVLVADILTDRMPDRVRAWAGSSIALFVEFCSIWGLLRVVTALNALTISSGANALNVSIILGIMAIPTVVSVSEDALQSAGREIREGSYALGATRAETLIRAVLPAASGGIVAAVILGVMRAIGETMVVWMASGNAARIPTPWFNYIQPVRTMTATIAGDMGEADHVTGSSRYHVLFAMALCLLAISFLMNVASEFFVKRTKRRMGK